MRNWKQLIPYIAGTTLVLASVGLLNSRKVSAAVRAAFVEIVIPSNPFFGSMTLDGRKSLAVGPETGTLGVTNIIVTYLTSNGGQLDIFAPAFTSGGCGVSGGTILGPGEGPHFTLNLTGSETTTITFPSPLTFTGAAGHTCIAASFTGSDGGARPTRESVQVSVNGFVN